MRYMRITQSTKARQNSLGPLREGIPMARNRAEEFDEDAFEDLPEVTEEELFPFGHGPTFGD